MRYGITLTVKAFLKLMLTCNIDPDEMGDRYVQLTIRYRKDREKAHGKTLGTRADSNI